MIEIAFISGAQGKALCRKGQDYFAVLHDGSSRPSSATELHEVARRGSEYFVFRDTTAEFVADKLHRATEQHNLLFLVLCLIDTKLSLSCRLLAAQTTEPLLANEQNVGFIANRLLSKSLPIEERNARRSVMQVAGEFPALRLLLQEIFDAQPVIDQLQYEWQQALNDSQLDATTLASVEAELVEAGFFSRVIRAISSRNLSALNEVVVGFAVSPLPELGSQKRSILTGFRSQLERRFFSGHKKAVQGRLRLTRDSARVKVKATGDFLSHVIERAAVGYVDQRMNAYEAKSAVDRQIEAIREMIFAGKNSLAEKYLQDLLHFQLRQGDQEHAVMSLCSLTAISLDANQLEMADVLASYAIKLGDDDAVAHTIRAEVFKQRGHFQSALNAYKETICRFPDNRYALNGIADVLQELGRFQEAMEQYSANKVSFPDDTVAYNGQVSVVRAQGKLRDALRLAISNAKRFPFDSVTRATLAGTLAANGKYDEALRNIRIAAEYGTNSRIFTTQAMILKSLGRIEEALNFLDYYISKDRREPGFLYTKATILRSAGRFEEALQIFSALIIRYPTYTPARFGAATVHLLMGRFDEAVRQLPEENLESELDWFGYRAYALSFLASGDTRTAIEKLTWGIQNCPWLREKTKLETALGLSQLRSAQADSIKTLQRDLDKLEERHRQCRLILLVHAHAQSQHADIANVILRTMITDKDVQVRRLKSAMNTALQQNSLGSETIHIEELNLVLAA